MFCCCRFVSPSVQNENCIDDADGLVGGASEFIESSRCHLELFCSTVFI